MLALLLDQTHREATYEIYECKSDSLVEELQEDVQTAYIYIPAKKRQHRSWGKLSGYRKELEERYPRILSDFMQGISMKDLADAYHLSVSAIQKNNERELLNGPLP